jgi:predicted NAD-dependent protein-ADP-ribosyltransferase YbiA (DUF1768 family)
MVVSLLDPKINYAERKNIHLDDVNEEVSIYEVPLYGNYYDVGLGTTKYDYVDKEILYIPIYLIVNNRVKEQIGMYEVNGKNIAPFLDEEGDVMIEKMNKPLLFSYVKKEYLNRISSNLSNDQQEGFIDPTDYNDQDDTSSDEDTMVIPLNSISIPEQSLAQSKKERASYQQDKKEPWIRTFLKNPNIGEVDNEGGGHCLFAVIRDAYATRGINVSIQELREKLSNYATQDQYQYYRGQYEMYRDAVKEQTAKMKSFNKQNEQLRKTLKTVSSRDQQLKLVEESQKVKESYEQAKENKKFSEELGSEFSFMKNVLSLEDFKQAIKEPSYWADAWAISALERILNIKLILFSEESYESGDMSNVLLCGESAEGEGEEDPYDPKEYIMTYYTGNHYVLITYYEHGLLDFSQVPYDVKLLIVNKCMEKLAGPYYNIKAFRIFQEKIGVKQSEPVLDEVIEDIHSTENNIRKDIVFQFYANSSDKKKPGMGIGEKIPKEDIMRFSGLNNIKDWRKKLDNSWEQAFELDGHKWKSVEHYYNASKFLKNNPDFYLKFSLDSNSDISKDVAKAIAAGSNSGKLGKEVVRPKEINMDEDFYIEIGNNRSRAKKELQRAIEAKMTQNKDLQKMLLETKDASLQQFIRGKEPRVAEELMKVREMLS